MPLFVDDGDEKKTDDAKKEVGGQSVVATWNCVGRDSIALVVMYGSSSRVA
jgi:hypothetical protein